MAGDWNCRVGTRGRDEQGLKRRMGPGGLGRRNSAGEELLGLCQELDLVVANRDSKTGQAIQTMEGHSSTVTSAHFSPDGSQIVSSSYDKTVRVWDSKTGQAIQTMEGHSWAVTSAHFSLLHPER